jgi:cation diffusion facilitator CzcD-associated flavoprotein CzcO
MHDIGFEIMQDGTETPTCGVPMKGAIDFVRANRQRMNDQSVDALDFQLAAFVIRGRSSSSERLHLMPARREFQRVSMSDDLGAADRTWRIEVCDDQDFHQPDPAIRGNPEILAPRTLERPRLVAATLLHNVSLVGRPELTWNHVALITGC